MQIHIASARLTSLFVVGIAVQVINFDAFAVFGGAAKEIAKADLGTADSAIALLFGLTLILSVCDAPTVVYAIAPTRSAKLLGAMTEWIMANSRMVEIVTGLGFGALFPFKGLGALLRVARAPRPGRPARGDSRRDRLSHPAECRVSGSGFTCAHGGPPAGRARSLGREGFIQKPRSTRWTRHCPLTSARRSGPSWSAGFLLREASSTIGVGRSALPAGPATEGA